MAVGASVTAGFQSGGINDSTQREAYPAKLADRMGTDFGLPLLDPRAAPRPSPTSRPANGSGAATRRRAL